MSDEVRAALWQRSRAALFVVRRISRQRDGQRGSLVGFATPEGRQFGFDALVATTVRRVAGERGPGQADCSERPTSAVGGVLAWRGLPARTLRISRWGNWVPISAACAHRQGGCLARFSCAAR